METMTEILKSGGDNPGWLGYSRNRYTYSAPDDADRAGGLMRRVFPDAPCTEITDWGKYRIDIVSESAYNGLRTGGRSREGRQEPGE